MNAFFRLLHLTLWVGLLLYTLPAHAGPADELLDKAYTAYENEQWPEVLDLARQAAQAFQSESKCAGWLQSQNLAANAHWEQHNDPFAALSITQGALAAPWIRLQQEDDYYRYCKVLVFDAWLAKQIGDFGQVRTDMEKAYAYLKSHLPNTGHKIAGFIYTDLGNAYVRIKEFTGARRIFEDNVQYSKAHPDCFKFNDYGSLYLSLDSTYLTTALAIFEQGLEFDRQQPAEQKLPAAEVKLLYLNKAECLAQMGRLEEALEVNRLAADYPLDKDDERYNRCLYGLYENYGIIYAAMARRGRPEKFVEAVGWYKAAVGVASGSNTPGREVAGFQIGMAEIYALWGKKEKALQAYHDALRTLIPGLPASLNAMPQTATLFTEAMLIRALYGKARIFHDMGRLEQSLACYELIPIVETKLRAAHAYESSSLNSLSESRKRFQEAIEIAWILFERDGGSMQYAWRAFQLSERAKGMLLLQSLVQAQQFLPKELSDNLDGIRSRKVWLDNEIAFERQKGTAADAAKIAHFDSLLFDLNLQQQQLLEGISHYNDPDQVYAQVLSHSEVPALLRPNQAMIHYFLSEDYVFIFSFDPGGIFHWRRTDMNTDLRSKVQQFAAGLWKPGDKFKSELMVTAYMLDSLLLAPEAARWPKETGIVVVPDGLLNLIPFDVLLSRQVQKGNWRDLPWRLNDYHFAYAYSATLLHLQQQIRKQHAAKAQQTQYVYGGFAPRYNASSTYKLKNTQKMAANIQDMLGGAVWRDGAATKTRFIETAPRCQTLLLAMHGIADDEHPNLSKLLFGDPSADSLDLRNVLYASELQVMRLQADLVVLSACHSGAGKLEQGEGVYSLARAFAGAGIPSTLMSLWLLHEETAPQLIESFFQYLQQGKTKDEALRLAKLDFIRNDDHFAATHPFYWAGLSISGDMERLQLPPKAPPGMPYKEIGLGLLLVAGLFMAYKLLKKRQ